MTSPKDKEIFIRAVKNMKDNEVRSRVESIELLRDSNTYWKERVEKVLKDPEWGKDKVRRCEEAEKDFIERLTIYKLKLMGLLK